MNKLARFAIIAGIAGLTAACGGKGDDALGDNVAEAYDNAADNAEAAADNATDPATEDALERRADQLEDEGARKEEAIDDADVNAAAVNSATLNQL